MGRLRFYKILGPMNVRAAGEGPVCTENSIQLETNAIQPGGVLHSNFSYVIMGRSVEPGW